MLHIEKSVQSAWFFLNSNGRYINCLSLTYAINKSKKLSYKEQDNFIRQTQPILIFHYIKGYMFRPYNQVIIRPTSKLILQMLCLMGSHLVHIRKNIKLLIQFS